jgi:hypothetical protein
MDQNLVNTYLKNDLDKHVAHGGDQNSITLFGQGWSLRQQGWTNLIAFLDRGDGFLDKSDRSSKWPKFDHTFR